MKILYFIGVLFALFLCISLAEKATDDEMIRKNFYFGRSPDIILKSKNFISKEDSLLVRLDAKKTVSEPILDIDIAYSLWAPSHGVEAISNNRIPFLEGADLFSKTKLNLLFAIDSIGKGVLSKFPSLHVLGGEQRSLKQSAYAEDSISMLTSIISGAEPSAHGIIGSTWQSRNGHTISAFKSPNTMSVINNYPDLLSKLFVGKSIVFGASSDFQIASSLSAHPVLYADHPFWNDYGFYFDPTLDSFESLYPFAVFEPELMLSKAKLLSKWEKTIGSEKVHISIDNSRMNIDISNDLFASYDADRPEEFSLIAELRFVFAALEMFSSKENWQKLIEDDSPDYISFGFASLKKIKQLYGVESAKFKVALFAVDALISHTVSTFKKLYHESVHSHAIFVSPDTVTFPTSVQSVVTSTLSSVILNPKTVNLPFIYLNTKTPLSSSCSNLREQLASHQVDVFCPLLDMPSVPMPQEEVDQFKPYQFILESLASNNCTNSTITWEDVMVFQLMFWFTIAIVLALVAGSCAVFMVDIPRHANLIRQLPNIYQDTLQQRNLW